MRIASPVNKRACAAKSAARSEREEPRRGYQNPERHAEEGQRSAYLVHIDHLHAGRERTPSEESRPGTLNAAEREFPSR